MLRSARHTATHGEAQARRPQRETLPGLDGPDKNFYYVVVQTPAVI